MTQELYSLIVGLVLILIGYPLILKFEREDHPFPCIFFVIVIAMGAFLVLASLSTYFVYIGQQFPTILPKTK